MKNIIKSQFYQIKNERLLVIVFFTLMAALLMNAFFGMGDGEALSAGETAVYLLPFEVQISALFIFMQTGIFCCSDFKDKTANYELMSGHTRKEVYFGRVIPCLIVGTLGWILLMCMPYVILTLLRGWGTEISFRTVMVRFLLMIFPVLRLICEFIFISFLVRNPYIVMAAGYVAFCIGGMSFTSSCFLGMTNLTMLSTIDVWVTFGLSGSLNYVYESYLTSSEIIGTIVSSVIFGGASLYMGYYFFRTDDVN